METLRQVTQTDLEHYNSTLAGHVAQEICEKLHLDPDSLTNVQFVNYGEISGVTSESSDLFGNPLNILLPPELIDNGVTTILADPSPNAQNIYAKYYKELVAAALLGTYMIYGLPNKLELQKEVGAVVYDLVTSENGLPLV